MEHTGEPFIPRSRFAAALDSTVVFINQYLTPISILVAVLGLALLLFGPVRLMLTRPDSGNGATLPAQGVDLDLALPDVDEGDQVFSVQQLSREIVPFTIIPNRPRDTLLTYTVQRGDTVTTIADSYSLDRSTIYWSNAQLMDSVHMLLVDMELYILPVDGVYHKSDGVLSIQRIADIYGVEPEAIIDSPYNEFDNLLPGDIPEWGRRIIVPGGEGEIPDWRPPIQETVTASGTVTRTIFPGMPGSCAASTGSGGTGAWVNPLPGGYSVTATFDSFHNGIDLAAPVGASVAAADTGRVVFAGWNTTGYGNLIILDHGNGWTTYYGHLSSVGVSCGQVAARGSYIGGVGSTGNSSGAHLHFEMRWSHTSDNPAYYIGF